MVCQRCSADLPLRLFNSDPRNEQGKKAWCKACKKAYQKRYARARRAEEQKGPRAKGRWGWYGLTQEDYTTLLAQQAGGCAGCGKSPKPDKRLAIDHRHQPKDKRREPWERATEVRGLLCCQCNRLLGRVRDNPNILANLARYLEDPPALQVVLTKVYAALEAADRSGDK